VARFFFDIHDSKQARDDHGVELPDLAAVRQHVMRSLPQIASHEIPRDGGDHQSFFVLVTDQDGQPVYSATLTYTGLWLMR
jgi:hypothetical protein